MTDYGHDLLFGTFLTPSVEQPERVVALAQLTEQLGLDLVTVQDHPYQSKFLDTWTLLSVIAASTSRVRVSPNVANLPLRGPVLLARSAATLDLLTGGRVELGLGAGAFFEGIAALGGPRLTPGQAVSALEEGIAVIRALWDADGPAVRLDGEHHRVRGAHPGPAPAHDIGIWLGAYKPRMLAMTGRLADGWLPSSSYVGPDALPGLNRAINAAAEQAGRDPRAIRRLYNIGGRFSSRDSGFLDGSPTVWAEQLAELALAEGMSGFVLMGDDPEVLQRFAAEVVPAVRDAVDYERARPVGQGQPSAEAAAPESVAVVAPVERVSNLPVVPTPDPGVRLSAESLWDEAARPTGPAPDPARSYSAQEASAGQHLVDVHDHLRSELEQLRDLVEQVTTGTMSAGVARSHIATMTLRQNNWTVGTYCETYCRVVTQHHTLEDSSMFPHLRRSEPGLGFVIDRLEEEHHAIHDVIERMDRALVAFVSGPEGVKDLRAALDLLTDTLLSHLSYEERELVEPLARHGFY